MPSHLEFMVLMEREGTPLLGKRVKGQKDLSCFLIEKEPNSRGGSISF